MIEIIPAIMPKSLDDLASKVSLMRDFAKWVQVDVTDGIFVPSKDWPYLGDGELELERLSSEAEGLPFWGQVSYEADLMVEAPEHSLSSWIQAGFGRIIVHVESVKSREEVLRITDHAKEFEPGDTLSNAIELGIAINIETPLSDLDPWMPYINFVQCMGIARIGYQGEPFDERVIQKIYSLKENYPDAIISVDGGVSLENAQTLVDAGASRLVVGSKFVMADNPKEMYQKFLKIANS